MDVTPVLNGVMVSITDVFPCHSLSAGGKIQYIVSRVACYGLNSKRRMLMEKIVLSKIPNY